MAIYVQNLRKATIKLRTAFTFPSENLASAIEYWEEYTKSNSTNAIFQVSNITVLSSCNHCVKFPKMHTILGQGYCEKHNYKFHMSIETQPCPLCAEENNLCHSCGSKIDGKGV